MQLLGANSLSVRCLPSRNTMHHKPGMMQAQLRTPATPIHSGSLLCVKHNCSSSLNRAVLSTCHASKPKNPDGSAAWRGRGMASGELGFCLDQIKAMAKPRSTWPPKNKAAFMATAQAVGGQWLLVQSGEWELGPREGLPAYAVLHLLPCKVEYVEASSSSEQATVAQRRSGGVPHVEVLQEPVLDAPGQHFMMGTFKLDEKGWPTGELYNSPSHFESLTTRRANHKPQFMNVVWEKETRETVQRWTKHHLIQAGITKPPRVLQHHLRQWYHQVVEQGGSRVDSRDDAVTILQQQRKQHGP